LKTWKDHRTNRRSIQKPQN